MSGRKRGSGSLRPLDIFIIIFFLAIAAAGLEFFRRDLLQTFSLQNAEPVGTIVIKRNTVQRRLSDRVVWDRLSNESPVYVGDLIRVAEISNATLFIDANSIDIEENTLIRITRGADGEGVRISLSEGSLSLAADENAGSLTIDLNGQQIQTGQGTVLSASVSDERRLILVNEGSARFVGSGGETREIPSGALIATGADGRERMDRAVVVSQPLPHARYVKTSSEPLLVNFAWNRVRLAPDMLLRLEIAQDSGFSRITRTVNNLNSSAQAQFDTGLWFYRILYQNEVLGTGQLSVADGSGARLVSPAFNSRFTYQDELPSINFQWAGSEEAVSYILEVSNSSDFFIPQVQTQVFSASHAVSGLGEGMWFWRVRSVFPPVFGDGNFFSSTAFFRIERSAEPVLDISLAEWIAQEAPSSVLPSELPSDIAPVTLVEITPLPVPEINLENPVNGAQIAGLTALRQSITFIWNTSEKIVSSRFILSRNVNPLQSPERIIANPPRSINIENLAQGVWYWTIEIQTEDKLTVVAQPSRVQVMPIPLLPVARNMQPAGGARFGHADLLGRSVVFRWAAVQGATAYNFTLYQQTQGSRRQIIRTVINGGTSYTLPNLNLLSRGTFVWQLEAVHIRGGEVEQRGNVGENIFIIDIPSPGPVRIEDTGVLYGN